MDLVTLHELSVMLDVSVRVLRSRVRLLVQAGKLVEGRDWRRENYVNENHFVWKVSPAAFAREAGLRLFTPGLTPVTPPGSQPANQPLPGVNGAGAQPGETLIKPDTKSPGLEREMIDLLKDQVRVKDGQIADLSEQNKSVTSLNLKLTGQIVQQADQIKNLLRLTGGKSELADVVTKPVTQTVTPDNPGATKPANPVNPGDATAGHQSAMAV